MTGMINDPNQMKEYNFTIFDLQDTLAETNDVYVAPRIRGGAHHDTGRVMHDGEVLFEDRTPGRCHGFVLAVALYRTVKAKNPAFSDQQVLATMRDFVAPRQPFQGANPYLLDAVNKRAKQLIEVAESEEDSGA